MLKYFFQFVTLLNSSVNLEPKREMNIYAILQNAVVTDSSQPAFSFDKSEMQFGGYVAFEF